MSTQNASLVPVNSAHQQVVSKLTVISGLRSQKSTSKIPEEEMALQTLIDIRSTEVQPLLATYITALNTFLGQYNTLPTTHTGATGPPN